MSLDTEKTTVLRLRQSQVPVSDHFSASFIPKLELKQCRFVCGAGLHVIKES